MLFLLKVIKKIKQCNAISPKSNNKISLTWRDDVFAGRLSLLVAGLLLTIVCPTISANERVAEQKTMSSDSTDIEPSKDMFLCDTSQPKIIFKPQTIFDKNEEGFTFLHRWANAIHIDTKIITLENEANFFIKKCTKTFADMAELERHLRSQKYLRDAEVSSDEDVENITITTWDKLVTYADH